MKRHCLLRRRELAVWRYLAAVSVAVSLAGAGPVTADEPSIEVILANWRQYLQAAHPKELVIERRSGNFDSITQTVTRCGILEDTYLRHETAEGPGLFKEVIKATNRDYNFAVWRDDGKGGASVDYGPPDLRTKDDQLECCPLLTIGFDEGQMHLLKDIDSGTQHLTNVRTEGEFVRVDLRPGPKAGPIRANATLTLDPKAHYVIRSGRVRYATNDMNAPEWTFENEYDVVDGLAIPKSRRMTSLEGSNPPPIGELIVKTFSLTTPPPPEAFRASYYGVPEPPTTRTPGSYRIPTWFYLAVGGILCVVAGFGILHLARRRAA